MAGSDTARPRTRLWKCTAVGAFVVVSAYGVFALGPRPREVRIHDLLDGGGRVRYEVTRTYELLPLYSWGFGTLRGCGPSGGSTLRRIGFFVVEDTTTITKLH